MSQFIDGANERYHLLRELEQLKQSGLKNYCLSHKILNMFKSQNTRSGIKCCNHRERRKTKSQTIHMYQGKFQLNFPLVDKWIVQCDIPVVKNDFFDDGDIKIDGK